MLKRFWKYANTLEGIFEWTGVLLLIISFFFSGDTSILIALAGMLQVNTSIIIKEIRNGRRK